MTKTITGDIKITEVTLLEDRAQVKREGRVLLPKGDSRILIPEVAPVLSDKSIVVKGDILLIIGDVTVNRVLKVKEKDLEEKFSKVKKDLHNIEIKINLEIDKLNIVNLKISSLEEITAHSHNELPRDIAWNKVLTEEQKTGLAEFDSSLYEYYNKQYELKCIIDELNLQKQDLQSLLNSLQTPSTNNDASILFNLNAEKEGEYNLSIEYVVPGACWRPRHKAELKDNKILFLMDGCVWQNTGEDWTDVQLFFSTQRVSLGTSAPVLQDDFIRIQKKPKEDIVEAREEVIEDVGLGSDEPAKEVSNNIPGIDDGGIVQNLKGLRKASIPSTGNPYRINISSFESDTDASIVLMPELSKYAFLKSIAQNKMEHPILAGPVDLIKNGGYIGRTSVLYIAQNEKFILGWGPDPEIRIYRDVFSKLLKKGVMNSWRETMYVITLYLSNIGSNEKTLSMEERIPVSEIEKVKINYKSKETTHSPVPDKNGIIRWNLSLKAKEKIKLKLLYNIKAHKTVKGI